MNFFDCFQCFFLSFLSAVLSDQMKIWFFDSFLFILLFFLDFQEIETEMVAVAAVHPKWMFALIIYEKSWINKILKNKMCSYCSWFSTALLNMLQRARGFLFFAHYCVRNQNKKKKNVLNQKWYNEIKYICTRKKYGRAIAARIFSKM